jgi:SpoVK/Ycf46/Vps4 family AAA+-type ATPase
MVLNALFNTAESKGWIIFLDEGDALLGQRRSAGDNGANTHYANQDVAFLLQRIENYDGIIIVATNLRHNIDQVFTRRFQAMVSFQPLPGDLQLELWNKMLPEKIPLDKDVDLPLLIKRYPLPPAAIINVIIRAASLQLRTMKRQSKGKS